MDFFDGPAEERADEPIAFFVLGTGGETLPGMEQQAPEIIAASDAMYDAFTVWNRTGGAVGPTPDFTRIIRECGVTEGQEEQAVAAFYLKLSMAMAFAGPQIARQASFN